MGCVVQGDDWCHARSPLSHALWSAQCRQARHRPSRPCSRPQSPTATQDAKVKRALTRALEFCTYDRWG